MKFKCTNIAILILFIAFFSFQITGCGSSGDDEDSTTPDPNGDTVGSISVTSGAPATGIVADGISQALISATVLDTSDNNIADGTTVTFTTTAGDIDSATAGLQTTYTSATTNGVATATLTSPTIVGIATITARVGGVSDSTTVTFIPGAVNSISLTATPNNLTADSSSTSTIRAFVTDVNGNAVANGEIISFSVTAGTGILSAPTAATTGGVATVTYTASDTAGTETVTAEATNGTTNTVDITLIDASIGSVSVTSGSASILADGTSQTLISAAVLDTTGNNIADGTTVTFTTTAGDIDSTTAGVQTTYTSTTTNGVASATLTSSTNVGTATITATAGGVSDSTSVSFVSGAVNSILLTATPNNLTADSSSTSTIRAFVTDVNGNAVANGEIISFSVTAGTGILSAPTAATTGGAATVTYTASDTAGTETVRAQTANGTTATKDITLIAVKVGSITVQAGHNELIANGNSNTIITATVVDSIGNPAPDDTVVNFTNNTAYGSLSANSAQTVGGSASVVLTSPVQSGHTAIIQAECGLIAITTVVFVPGVPQIIQAVATPSQIVTVPTSCTDDISVVRATIMDDYNNPVADGTEIDFSIDKGWIWDKYPDCSHFDDLYWVTSKTVSTSNGVASIAVVGSGIVETGTVDICVEGLCYEDQEGNRGLEVSYGSTTGKGSGLPASIELSSSVPSIQVKGTGGTETATITAKVYDETGNPIKDSYTSGDGSTTEGSPVFVSYSAKFVTRGFSADDELTIHSGDDAGTYQIISVDSEMQVTLNSNMTQDSDAVNFTATVQDNIVFSLSGPGGGENLDGETSAPFTSTKSTVDGQASVTLNSGVLSGTVTIQADCTQGGSTATAISPQIGIEAGPPFNISLYKAPDIEDNGDGSMSWIISAMLQDQYGNPVANDTGVYFGLVDNQPDGYKSSGANGITDGTATFVSAGTNFPGDGVVKFDTLIILEGQDEGGNTIDTPAHGSVTLFYTPTGSETDLDFVAGNAELGVVCGVVPTGNLEPDTTCTPSGGIAIKGVAHTRLTWAEPAIFKPFYLYAETEGRNLGKTFGKPYSYPGIEPVAIDITLDPASVFAGEEFITVNAHFHDGATPSHNIREEELTFTTDNTNISGFGGIGAGFETTTDDTNDNGVAVTTLDVVTNDCIDSERNVTISVSHEQYMGTATLTIKATAPTANFSSTDGGNHNTVFFVDSSTTVAGTSITDWEWDFDGDSSTIESTVRSPTYNFGTANDYTVTLTVTNDFGCTDSLTKVITVP